MSTSGKFLSFTVSAATYVPLITSWRANETGETLDDTSAYDSGYERWSDGVTGVEIDIECYLDPALGAVPTVGKGQTLTACLFKGNSAQATATDYNLPTAIVVGPSRSVEVRGQIKLTFKVRSQGIFYRDGIAARN